MRFYCFTHDLFFTSIYIDLLQWTPFYKTPPQFLVSYHFQNLVSGGLVISVTHYSQLNRPLFYLLVNSFIPKEVELVNPGPRVYTSHFWTNIKGLRK